MRSIEAEGEGPEPLEGAGPRLEVVNLAAILTIERTTECTGGDTKFSGNARNDNVYPTSLRLSVE